MIYKVLRYSADSGFDIGQEVQRLANDGWEIVSVGGILLDSVEINNPQYVVTVRAASRAAQ
jgi:hypothetical protein